MKNPHIKVFARPFSKGRVSPRPPRALITGSSRGIGSAIAEELARSGADVIISYCGNREAAERTAAKINGDRGAECAHIEQADLSKPEETRALAGRGLEKFGGVDILVSNASMQYREKWENITEEQYLTQMNCNFYSALLLIQAFVPGMREKGWGRIVTVGSVQEKKPHPDMLIYSSSKAAQENMVRSLALQLAGDGITVNNVCPGVIYTDRNTEALSDPEYAAKVTSQIPMLRYGEKEECAPIVRLLCSDEGAYITGQSIYVDGGKSIQ